MLLLAGTFANPADAAHARKALVDSGIPADRLFLSALLTADGIAAEAPGQSFENQGYRSSDQVEVVGGWTDQDRARFNEELRAASSVLSVRLDSPVEQQTVTATLRQYGAKSCFRRPGPMSLRVEPSDAGAPHLYWRCTG